MWRDDGGRRRDGNRIHERIRAIALMVGDAIEKFLHETLALLDSVTRSDIASFIERMDVMQKTQDGARSALDALATTFSEVLAEMRGLRSDVAAMRAGLAVDLAAIEERISHLEQLEQARNKSASSREEP